MRPFGILLVSESVTLDVVRRLEADENQLLSRERTDEQSTNEVEVLVTASTDTASKNSLLLTVVVFQFSTLLLRH